jgi:hypothetical protein
MFRPSLARSLRSLGVSLGFLATVACGGAGSIGSLDGAGTGSAGGSSTPPSTPPASAQTANLEIRLHDSPLAGAEHVYVTIESVEVVHMKKEGKKGKEKEREKVETVSSVAGQYDLLSLQHGVEAVLGGGQFPAGDYKFIQLTLAKDSKEDVKSLPAELLKNYIVVDGVAHPLRVPKGQKHGIRLGHDFTVEEGKTTVLTLDFDVRQSIVVSGRKHPVYRLRPRIRVVPNVSEPSDGGTDPVPPAGGGDDPAPTPGEDPAPTPGEDPAPGGGDVPAFTGIVGTVSTSDFSGIPSDAYVSAQQNGVEIATSSLDANAGYSIVVPDGTYDLIVIAPGSSFASETGVVVSGGGTSAAHDFTIMACEIGSIFGFVTSDSIEDVTIEIQWNGFHVMTVGAGADGYVADRLCPGTYTVIGTGNASSQTQTATVSADSGYEVDFFGL